VRFLLLIWSQFVVKSFRHRSPKLPLAKNARSRLAQKLPLTTRAQKILHDSGSRPSEAKAIRPNDLPESSEDKKFPSGGVQKNKLLVHRAQSEKCIAVGSNLLNTVGHKFINSISINKQKGFKTKECISSQLIQSQHTPLA